MLLELCDVHRENRHILIPLEIVVDILLYNGPFLVVLLRLLYLAWKVAYDEAVLTGAIFEDDSTPGPLEGTFSGRSSSRGGSGSRPGAGGYVGLAMVDMDEAERGHGRGSGDSDGLLAGPHITKSGATVEIHQDHDQQQQQQQEQELQQQADDEDVYVLEDEDDDEQRPTLSSSTPLSSPAQRRSPVRSPVKNTKSPLKKNVMFDVDSSAAEEDDDDGDTSGQHGSRRPRTGEPDSFV